MESRERVEKIATSFICLTWSVPSIFLLLIYFVTSSHSLFPTLNPGDVLDVLETSCVVAFPEGNDGQLLKLMRNLSEVTFHAEPGIFFGSVKANDFVWPGGKVLSVQGVSSLESSVIIFRRLKKDRTCLYIPEGRIVIPEIVQFPLDLDALDSGDPDICKRILLDLLEDITKVINKNCETFRKRDGSLTYSGLHRHEILSNLYTLNKPTFQKQRDKEYCSKCTLDSSECWACNQEKGYELISRYRNGSHKLSKAERCEKIPVPTLEQFIHEYLTRSKPVVITGALDHWDALTKWTSKFLRQKYGHKKIHIKITPDGEYEGVEAKALWDASAKSSPKIPPVVERQLPFPDLVVVRPATMEIQFSEYLDLIENISIGRVSNLSAYLEYSSIMDYFPELRDDISEMPFFQNVLKLKHLNIWLSDGKTLGKLHFDPFDNFLCQVSGQKQVILYDPHHNHRLYEAHIQEAKLSYSTGTRTFNRTQLLESTSMVMSPVNILKPNLQRFPEFEKAQPLRCDIQVGEVLFMPAFWWHEVQSQPNLTERRNLAVNFWYDPFLTREFPCPDCQLDINPNYHHLLGHL